MCSDGSDWTCLQPGFPIRKSSDHSLVIDSPRLIADSYVLHRFLVPRHPPYALKNLHKILRTNLRNAYRALQMLRVHYAILKQHTATPTNHTKLMQPAQGLPTQKKQTVPSGPNNVSDTVPARPRSTARRACTDETSLRDAK